VITTITFFLILAPEVRLFQRRRTLYVCLALMLPALALTFSKAAMAGFLVGSIASLYLRWPARSLQISGALTLAALLTILAISIQSQIRGEQSES